MKVVTSKVKASIGRVVHVYCPDLWTGPQPGIVSNGPYVEPVSEFRNGDGVIQTVEMDGQVVNVNALVDAQNNPKALEFWRSRPQGNTLCSVPLYDSLTPEQRVEVAGRVYGLTTGRAWCEWPPNVCVWREQPKA